MIKRTTLPSLIFSLVLFHFGCQPEQESEIVPIPENLPFQSLDLNEMNAFQQLEANNWQLAENVYANRKQRQHLEADAGQGILVNLPDEQNRQNLFTAFEHGDIELEADFMMPQGSNSGIYLMGRYEVQLFDSWAKDKLGFQDCGSIYARYDEASEQTYEGTAPPLNASRAPGLWQHIHIKFQAPRFDANGNKIANARFEKVVLNGSTLHENVEVSGPTRAAAFLDEKHSGPLMLQGDHGPVAFRNIRYKLYGDDQLSLSDIQYKLFEGKYDNFDTLQYFEASKTESIDSITFNLMDENAVFAAEFNGTLNVPASGDYLFELACYGPAELSIDGNPLVDNKESQNFDEAGREIISLQEGSYPFTLTFLKNEQPWRKGLILNYEGPGIAKTRLHAASSAPKSSRPEPIIVNASKGASLQRGFVMHGDKKLTHTNTVGTPQGIHYAFALNSGSLLSGWRGDYIDCQDMWHQRGEAQLIEPLGSEVEFSSRPMLARLDEQSAPWPDSVGFESEDFRFQGYSLNEEGLPSYQYLADGVKITDLLLPDEEQYGITRRTSLELDEAAGSLYYLLAEGQKIEQLPDESYGIDDRKYYIELSPDIKDKVMIRSDRGQQQLILPLSPSVSDIQYSLIW
ncbi:MAG: family 16 glycoside hydrolase [Cyclobacteriaceae bacterium]